MKTTWPTRKQLQPTQWQQYWSHELQPVHELFDYLAHRKKLLEQGQPDDTPGEPMVYKKTLKVAN